MRGLGWLGVAAIGLAFACACASKSRLDGNASTPDAAEPDASTPDAGEPASGCGPGDACCFGGSCTDGACCVRGRCVANGTQCEAGVGACQNGKCSDCGEPGQVCCPGAGDINCSILEWCNACNSPDFDCDSDDTCQPCGHDTERCCIDGCWDSPSVCLTDSPPTPYVSQCTTECGVAGEPCCSGALCNDGSCCLPLLAGPSTGTCVAAPTCGCTDGECTTCGIQGLPCCEGSCADNLVCTTDPSSDAGATRCDPIRKR